MQTNKVILFCRTNRCVITGSACIRRQELARDPKPRLGDYRCCNCDQGQHIALQCGVALPPIPESGRKPWATISDVEEGFKRCSGCGAVLPATAEYFHREAQNRDGLRGECVECRLAVTRRR